MIQIDNREFTATKNYIAALSNYRKQLADMQENIQIIGDRSENLGGKIHQTSTVMILKKFNREIKSLDDSIYLLEEELKTLNNKRTTPEELA